MELSIREHLVCTMRAEELDPIACITDSVLGELFQYIFFGIIVSHYGETSVTVVVARPDQEGRTPTELYVMSCCTKEMKDDWYQNRRGSALHSLVEYQRKRARRGLYHREALHRNRCVSRK